MQREFSMQASLVLSIRIQFGDVCKYVCVSAQEIPLMYQLLVMLSICMQSEYVQCVSAQKFL